MSREKCSPSKVISLRTLTLGHTFGLEESCRDQIPDRPRSCSARVRVHYVSSLVGYGKFEYTREGVNQTAGIYPFIISGRALIFLNSPPSLSRPFHNQGSSRFHAE